VDTILHTKFVYDDSGRKIEVILPIDEYNRILFELMDKRDSSSIEERLKEPDEDFDLEDIKQERRLLKNGKN
jgi:hypothetical protein